MNNLPIKLIESEAWAQLIEKHGHGQIQPRYHYEKECTQDRFPDHHVVRGRWNGSLTGTGFLQDRKWNVVAGVDQIPI